MPHKVIAECIDRFTGQRLAAGVLYPEHPAVDPERQEDAIKHLVNAGCLREISDERAAEIARALAGGSLPSSVSYDDVDDLEKLTVAQLKELAKDEEVALDADMKKAEIVEAIRAKRAA